MFLTGGLGNQMFQYAAGRSLAQKHNTMLCLDISWYHYPIRRQFELNKFNINATVEKSLLSFVTYNLWNKTGLGKKHATVYREEEGGREDLLFGLPDGTVLVGYYQSERFFSSIANVITGELGLGSRAVDGETQAVLDRVGSVNSVALHVRRGDFLKHPNLQVCTKDYYLRGLDYLRTHADHPQFFIFSDDPDWCRTVFTAADCHVMDVVQSRIDSLNDMHLMSACRHMILSNSSYSWWAAWLGRSVEQMVVAPDRWLNCDLPYDHIYCPSWVRLPADAR